MLGRWSKSPTILVQSRLALLAVLQLVLGGGLHGEPAERDAGLGWPLRREVPGRRRFRPRPHVEQLGVCGGAEGARQPDAEDVLSVVCQPVDGRVGRGARERDDRVPCGRLEAAAVVPLLHLHVVDGDAPGLAGDRPVEEDGVVVSDGALQVRGRIGLRKWLHEDADRNRRAQAVRVGRGQCQVGGEGDLRRRRNPADLRVEIDGKEAPAAVAGPQVGQRVAVRVGGRASQRHKLARVDRAGISRGRDRRGLADDRLDVGDGDGGLVGRPQRDLCRQRAEADLHAFPVVLDAVPGRREP